MRSGANAPGTGGGGMDDEAARREAALYAALDRLGIAHRTVEHEAVFTVAESAPVKAALPGGHAKTLLVTDRRTPFLIAALGSARVDLKRVARIVGARGRLSFAGPDALRETLGLTPGSVTPFGLLHEGASRIGSVVLDEALLTYDPVWFHPLRNTASTAVSPEGLERFCEAHAKAVITVPLASREPVTGSGSS